MQNRIGPGTLELGHQGRQVRCCCSIAFFEHHIHAVGLALALVARSNACAIGTVLINNGNTHVLHILVETGLGLFLQKRARGLAKLIGVHLGSEDILEVFILKHG